MTFSPWTGLWERNFFARGSIWLMALLANPYVRGAVSGIGLITVLVGIRDLAATLLTRQSMRPAVPPIDPNRPAS